MDAILQPIYSFVGVERLEPVADDRSDSISGFASPALSPRDPSYSSISIEELAALQGVEPLESIDDLRGDFWTGTDDLDGFLEDVRRWRNGESSKERT